jgi:preprotein translocase subunit SecG
MQLLFVILIIIASFILGLIVLIQNPKGGGLAGSLGGFSTQLMGVKQTTDVLEKGTWIFAGVIALLSLLSTFFIGGAASSKSSNAEGAQVPTSGTPAPGTGTLPKPNAVPYHSGL